MKRKEEQRNDTEIQKPEGAESRIVAAEVPSEVGTPAISVSRNLAATVDINGPPSIVRNAVPPFILQDLEHPKAPVDIPATAISSPTSSFSAVSDLTPTEFGEIEQNEEQEVSRHDTFYFDDGNVEIVCGGALFRIHSTIISFSSSRLRDILSPTSLFDAPMPEGRPRVTVSDNAKDFTVLLKSIYTPGWVIPSSKFFRAQSIDY